MQSSARTEDSPPQGFNPVYLEYQPGDYERVFTLSEDIEAERIEAGVKNGVLRLFLAQGRTRTDQAHPGAGQLRPASRSTPLPAARCPRAAGPQVHTA
jgi:Hsp20/alpha crystallin family